MNEGKIFLSPPHMGGTEQNYVNGAFKTNWIAPLGANVDSFEQKMKHYTKAEHVLALNSGTAAIHLALLTLGVTRGDTVFCSTLTFAASANPIVYVGAEPVFIDSDEKSWNMCPIALRNAMEYAAQRNRLPKAVIVVHLLGLVADLDTIQSICDKYDVPLIEDAAESLGSTYKNQMTGTFGEMGIYSFNGNKIITTSGGGMLLSKKETTRKKAFKLATQAKEQAMFYLHKKIGYNYRLSNVLAGIGMGQMEVLDSHIAKRQAIFKRYETAFSEIDGVSMMPVLAQTVPNCWLSAIRLDLEKIALSTMEIVQRMEAVGVEARMMWNPLHLQPSFAGAECYQANEQNVSEQLFQEVLCLPSGSSMSESQQAYVIKELLAQLLANKVDREN
ncbi:aminotransferase class I/II-fold pyridoxal phosphate-dependent enzyme [Listeria booriae]|uniref:aminotransferase class I/II-fold pyridoxal phosphate-dependent enzyme n=1 Tax=Listeria booriae TaxID=1552123 RepID=UPI001627C130|nr:aminotransferase class I/II-fold pyridoxal phosphate-dependent enzyme [Listeria booriae]MBC2034917.1 aminotransferase class I/II-fold pyridoxal phosphate-dependent enzyme [Listeria booriae]